MSWNIPAGQSVSGVQAVLSPSFFPTAEAEQEKEGPDIVHTLLSNDQNSGVINTSSHTQNLDAVKEVTAIPAKLYVAKCIWKHKGQLLYLGFGEGSH